MWTLSRKSLVYPALFGVALSALAGAAYSQAVNYSYDALGRIKAVTYADGKQIVYTYDAAGNRTQHVVSATTVNRAPVAVDDTKNATEGVALVFDPRTNDSDPDGNALTITNVSAGQSGTASVTGGGTTITYTATLGRSQPNELLTYSISDGNGMSASANVDITIGNGPPVAVTDSLAVNQVICAGHGLDPRVNDTDPGQDPLTVTAATNGTKGVAVVGVGGTSVVYTPNGGATGADSFTYTIADDSNATAVGTINVSINATQQNPTAASDVIDWTMANNGDTSRTIDPRTNDTDPEAQALIVTAKTNGTYGSVAFTSTQVTYTRTSNFPTAAQPTKTDTFTYTASDQCGGTGVGTVNVTVRYNSGGGGCGGSPCP